MSNPLGVWLNVYRRIRFFKKMYPLSTIAKDLVLFPRDYFFPGRRIESLRNLTIAITHKCNIRCEMCYFIEELGNKKELPYEDYEKIIDAAAASKPCVILSGGEPFAHSRIVDMVGYAKSKKLPVQIFTNGTLTKPAVADALINLGLDYIDFTLLGDPVSHAKVARAPKAYQMLIENLEYFAERRGDTKVILNFTITPTALPDIDHALELIDRYKLDGLRIQHYNFLLPNEFSAQERIMSRMFGMESETHEITGEENVAGMADQIRAFQKRLKEKMPNVPVQWAPTLGDDELDNWYSTDPFKTDRKCLYPWRGMLVDADGKIYPCSKIYLELGEALDANIFDVWNSDRMMDFRAHLKQGRFPACSRCCKL